MLRQYLDLDGLVYLWSKIKANFTNVIESISVNGTRQSVIDKNVNIEIPQSMPLTDVDSTPTCNSTNLVTSGGVYSYVDTKISTKAEDTTVVHKADTETITGNKTFSGTTTFTGITNLGSKATATTPAATDNATSVATTAFVKTAISGKQDTLVSGTNIKTVDNCSLIGSGNVATYTLFELPNGGESRNDIIAAAMSDTGYVHNDSENLNIASKFNKNIALLVPFYSDVILRPLVNGGCTNQTVTFWNEMTDNGVTMSFSVSINANTGQAIYKIIQSTGIDESNLVHKTGDENISGNKNFCGLINFELITAGRITVCGEDVVRTPDLATKLDKLTSSTDNAVVRFNGTTGNIQNSGVIINDSNQVTAAKFITSGGSRGQFVKGDGSLDDTSYLTACSLPYWANTQIDMGPKYNTEPEFKSVKINGSTDTCAASTENAVIQYDTATKVVKFVFN